MKIHFLFLLFILSSISLFAQNNRILLDEDFSDWQDVPIAHSDVFGDHGNSNIDFGDLWISNDDAYLFFRLEVGVEINLQNNNEVTLFLDTDNNSSTGLSVDGIGAEIVYNLGARAGNVYVNGNNTVINHIDISLVTLPTVTSDQFEMAVSRNLNFFGQNIYQGDIVRVLFKNDINNADQIPNGQGGIAYTFDNGPDDSLPAYSIDQSPDSQLRIMSYNVLFDNLFENNLQDPYERIIKSIGADIIGFQEIYDHSSAETASKVESFSPLGNGEQWYHSKIQPDIIAVSRFPILESHLIPVNIFSTEGNGAFLIDLDPTTNTKLLLIVAHTPCCDNDVDRQLEIDAIMAFIRNAKDGTGPIMLSQNDPIVLIGDMNLVGENQQQTTLITGDIVNQSTYGPSFSPDWDDTDLEDAKPLASNLPLAFTWYRESSSFSPGRLDYILYTGSVLDLKNTFSLFTPGLSSGELLEHGLSLNDAILASDHLPLVGDFELAITLAAPEIETEPSALLNIFPNPFAEECSLVTVLPQRSEVQIELLDLNGILMELVYRGELGEGKHIIGLNNHLLANGIYICRMKTESGVITKKVIVSK